MRHAIVTTSVDAIATGMTVLVPASESGPRGVSVGVGVGNDRW